MLPRITGEGRLGSDPELSFTPAGVAVARAGVACTKSRKNPTTNEWEDVSTTWVNLVFWRAKAEAFAEHARKGDLIVFSGELDVRQYEKRDGGKGTSVDVEGLWWGVVPRRQTQRSSAPAAADPWATQPAADEPPF